MLRDGFDILLPKVRPRCRSYNKRTHPSVHLSCLVANRRARTKSCAYFTLRGLHGRFELYVTSACLCNESIFLQLARVIDRLANFAEKYKDLPTLGFTHYQ